MTHDDYSAIPAVNWSTLKNLDERTGGSPRMYRYRLAHPSPSKPAYALGNAAHCAIFEPEKFDRRYVVLTPDEIEEMAPGRGTIDGKKLIKEHPEWATALISSDAYKAACFAATCPGKQMIEASERDEAYAMRDAAHAHPVAREMLRGGLGEETITWTDEETGLRCKSRIDYLRPDFFLDGKTTRDPAPSQFERDAERYGYLGQCGMYQAGAVASKRIDGKEAPRIIAIRNCDDFDVVPYTLTTDAMNRGRAIFRSLMRKLAQCIEADYWPGVAPEMKFLGALPWAPPIDESEDF